MKKEASSKNTSLFHLGLSTLIILVFFSVLFVSFYYLLNQQVPTKDFGWREIATALVTAFLASAVLSLTRGIMKWNPEMGLAAGLAAIVIALVALFYVYSGPYTNKFAIIGSLGAAVYIGVAFWKNRKK